MGTMLQHRSFGTGLCSPAPYGGGFYGRSYSYGGAEKVTTLNVYWFHVSFAGLGLGIGLVTAGLDYNTGNNTDGWWRGV